MRRLVVAAMLLGSCCGAANAQTQPAAEDRAAIDACLQREATEPQHCIGIVYTPCAERPPSDKDDVPPGSTPGREQCAARETSVWEEKIDAALKTLREGPLGQTIALPENRASANKRTQPVPGTELIDDMGRSWLTTRAKMCDTRSRRYEGGTLARIVYATCINEETARHALWLLDLAND